MDYIKSDNVDEYHYLSQIKSDKKPPPPPVPPKSAKVQQMFNDMETKADFDENLYWSIDEDEE